MNHLAAITWDAETITVFSTAAVTIIGALSGAIIAVINAIKAKSSADAAQQSMDRLSVRVNGVDDRITNVALNTPASTTTTPQTPPASPPPQT